MCKFNSPTGLSLHFVTVHFVSVQKLGALALSSVTYCVCVLIVTILYSSFGPGTGHIWLDNVACTGTELFVQDCDHKDFGENDCQHSKDVGLRCLRKSVERKLSVWISERFYIATKECILIDKRFYTTCKFIIKTY